MIQKELLIINDRDRANCRFFKEAKEFEDKEGVKYRKTLVLLAMFSLIYNFAGIKITGSGIGIVSGTISSPAIIGWALFIALIYSLVLYLAFLWSSYENYYLSITGEGNKRKFEQSLIIYFSEVKIKTFLKNNNIDVSRVQFHSYDELHGTKHLIEVHGADNYQTESIVDLLKDIGLERHSHKNIDSDFVFSFPYELSEDDNKYLNKHFKYLKLLHFKIFIEYRVPYIFAIMAVSSFWLRLQF
ncbi:hypothetical protein [Thalassotalea sp. G2M2-11]|uniref:hypothetical protein n=1 Tax=Thalassotalea sp. G2M2-11 TaxID=2787627 RepID=UPI0019D1C7AB|nr:hypothetical protein [Thalassotalea sp. G2M2-11]